MKAIGYKVPGPIAADAADRKSTRLNSSHGYISYAVFCLKKKTHRLDIGMRGERCVPGRAAANLRGAAGAVLVRAALHRGARGGVVPGVCRPDARVLGGAG